MASLQARSPLRSAHPLLTVSKYLSLVAFLVLLTIGWIAVSYLKNDSMSVWSRPETNPQPTSSSSLAPVSSDSGEAKQSTTPARLVYSCAEDKDFYHSSTHMSSKCERTALSEDAAIQRGLKRCKVCFPD